MTRDCAKSGIILLSAKDRELKGGREAGRQGGREADRQAGRQVGR